MKKPATYVRARSAIMHYVLSFCIANRSSDERGSKSFPSVWATDGFYNEHKDNPVKVGDLVLLMSAPASKLQIGWLRELGEDSPGWPKYLIESLDDQALCWWNNVSLRFLSRESISPEWRWEDRQFAFKDRWWKACYGRCDAYIVRPLYPEFGEGHAVTLGTRTSHGFDDIRPTRTFPDWRKLTIAQLADCYRDCCAERDGILARRRANAAKAA